MEADAGRPEVLTDNGKVFTGRFAQPPVEVEVAKDWLVARVELDLVSV